MNFLRRLLAALLMIGAIGGTLAFARNQGAKTLLPSAPGGSLSTMSAQLTDRRSGNIYDLDIVAREFDDVAGVGLVALSIQGPSISLCSAHGPPAEIDFSPGGEDFGGNFPLSDIQCGTAYGMSVVVDGCSAEIEMHGYVHADFPLTTYMGMMTLDLDFRTSSGPEDALVDLTIHTPKDAIKLGGTLIGEVTMDTCD